MKKHFFTFAIILVVALTAVISAVVFRSDSGETTPVVLPAETQIPGNVSAPQGEDVTLQNVIDVTEENVQTAVSALERPQEYFVQMSTLLTSSSGTRETLVSLWVSGEHTRTIVTSADSVKNILTEGTKFWIWYSDDTESVFGGSAESRSAALAEALNGLPDYTEVIGLDSELITDAGYTVFEDEPCIYVRTTEPGELESEYFISVGNGLLKGYTRTEDGQEVFSLVCEYAELSPDDSGLFELPS